MMKAIYGLLASILLDHVFLVEYELDEFHTPHTRTTFSRLQYWLCRLRCKSPVSTASYFISGQHFLETFTLLPETTRTTNSWVTITFLSLTSEHDFWYTYGNISHSHIQQCLNLTMHIFAQATIYLLPSYEACSINVNPFFHAAIKNHHKNFTASSYFFILLHLARKQQHTQQ